MSTLLLRRSWKTSHLLARLGRAERIGNLVGQFEFTSKYPYL